MWSTLKCLDLAINLSPTWASHILLSSNAVPSSQENSRLVVQKCVHWNKSWHSCGSASTVLDKNSFLLWYSHIRHQSWILLSRAAVGIGRYSKDSTAFCLLQHFPLACPFWLFRPEVLRQRFFVFCFLGQVVLGGFANRNSIDNQCPGNKHLLLNFLVLLIREAVATLQRYPCQQQRCSHCCALSPPPPPMHKPQQQRHATAIPSPLPRHLPFLSLFSSSKERESQVLVSFFFFFPLKIFLDSVHTTSSDVKGDGESLESRSG